MRQCELLADNRFIPSVLIGACVRLSSVARRHRDCTHKSSHQSLHFCITARFPTFKSTTLSHPIITVQRALVRFPQGWYTIASLSWPMMLGSDAWSMASQPQARCGGCSHTLSQSLTTISSSSNPRPSSFHDLRSWCWMWTFSCAHLLALVIVVSWISSSRVPICTCVCLPPSVIDRQRR